METNLTTVSFSQLTMYNEIYQNSVWGRTLVKIDICYDMRDDQIIDLTDDEMEEYLEEKQTPTESESIALQNFTFVRNRNRFASQFKLIRLVNDIIPKKIEVYDNLELYKKQNGSYILLIALYGEGHEEGAKKVELRKTMKLHDALATSYYKNFLNKFEINKFFENYQKVGLEKFKKPLKPTLE